MVVGVGAGSRAPVGEVLGLIADTLRDAGLPAGLVVELATVDSRAGHAGIVGAAARLGVPLRTHPAELLAGIPVPHPSRAALAAAGTPSVAEAAALAGGGELVVAKQKSGVPGRPGGVTCAVVRRTGTRGGHV